jgi:hypothetical protein
MSTMLWPLNFGLQKFAVGDQNLWDWDLAPKLKLFTWLIMENKILTWDNLQHRGWSGPSIFSLCFKNPETGLAPDGSV